MNKFGSMKHNHLLRNMSISINISINIDMNISISISALEELIAQFNSIHCTAGWSILIGNWISGPDRLVALPLLCLCLDLVNLPLLSPASLCRLTKVPQLLGCRPKRRRWLWLWSYWIALFYTKTLKHEVKARSIEHSCNEIDDVVFC